MYLKKLSLKGFKSFPIKTDILFEKGITAIVGPNGSGKSNISDAIRWVLGEQSVKSLRGEKMEDVIFSGTDNKKQHNYCEVSLTLGDIDDQISIDEDELVIKRRVYRTGESEYYINRKSCRLRDVKEILMDTGIGKDGYSIIEQGKVEEILSSNPQNRRKVFDEACGIAKYRYKKIESEKNLQKTEENLKRIIDIYTEIEKQVEPLKKQKEKAEKYLKLNDELKKYEVNDIIIKNEDLENSINDISFNLDESNKILDKLEEDKKNSEEDISNIEISLNDIEFKIEGENKKILDLNNEINSSKNEKELTEAKIANITHDIERKTVEAEVLEKKINLAREQLKKSMSNLENKEKELGILEKDIEENICSKKELEKEYNSKLDELNRCKEESLTMQKNKEEISNSIVRYSSELENIDSKIRDIEKTIDNISDEISGLEKNIDEKENKKSSLVKLIEEQEASYKSKEKEKACTEENIKAKHSVVNKYNIEVGSKKTKMNTYIDMENHHEGFNRGVREILNNKSIDGIHGAFGELIKVSSKYEKAIEATLGAMIQNIVVDDEGIAKTAINYLKKNNLGRVTFLPLNIIKGNEINIDTIKTQIRPIGIASRLVSYSDIYSNIVKNALGRVIVVENIDDGVRFSRETGYKYKVVTLDGEILNPGGSMTGGSIKTNTNILSRKRIIEELNNDILTLERNIKDETSLINQYRQDLEIQNKEINEIGISIKNIEKEIVSLETELKISKKELEKQRNLLKQEVSNKDSIKSNTESKSIELKEFESKLNTIVDNISKNERKIIDETGVVDKLRDRLNEEVSLFNEKNIEITKLRQILEGGRTEINRINEDLESNTSTRDGLLKSCVEDRSKLEGLNKLVLDLEVEINAKTENFSGLNSNIEELKTNKKEIKDKYDEQKSIFRNIEREITGVRENIYKLDSKKERCKNTRDNLLSSLFEKYELTYVQALEYRNTSLKIDYKKIEDLRRQIKSLGNINIDAIVEYDEVSHRYEYYSEQKKDLEESIVSIKELIDELVRNMEVEFLENFNQINTNFKSVYKKLFGGGNSDLRIVDTTNILESDIDIIAQPPGKKMKNLNLLSGGEKALTAICILFAILISKPTPFCILDEIEAPLDDVNIFRFGEYLKELSTETQFISVTHRRGTMEVSDYIYGVTMQEKGVSSVISMKLNDATKIAEG